jgi:hypothetical protein
VAANVARAHERLTAAASDGLVPAGTAATEMADLAEATREAHFETTRRLEDAKAAHDETDRRCEHASEDLREAEEALRVSIKRTEAADAAHAAVESQAATIGRMPAVLDAFGGGADENEPTGHATETAALPPPVVDEAADRILEALDRDLKGRTGNLDTLRLEHLEDQRLIAALGNGGLLPPRREVEDAVNKLRSAKVNAYPGWTTGPHHVRQEQA